jgi:hypothetical protein
VHTGTRNGGEIALRYKLVVRLDYDAARDPQLRGQHPGRRQPKSVPQRPAPYRTPQLALELTMQFALDPV